MNSTPHKFNVAIDEQEETSEIAQAILDTSRHLLTGMEIYMLEKIASMMEPDWSSFTLSASQISWFYSLQTQFAREISRWSWCNDS